MSATAWKDEPPPGFFDDEALPVDMSRGDVFGRAGRTPMTAPNGDAGRDPPIALLDGPALAAPLPELDYLVREIGLVAGGGAPHLVAGYGFSGKTLALQALALALVTGRPVWGAYHSPHARRVVHVDLEQGDRLTRRRYQRFSGRVPLIHFAAGS